MQGATSPAPAYQLWSQERWKELLSVAWASTSGMSPGPRYLSFLVLERAPQAKACGLLILSHSLRGWHPKPPSQGGKEDVTHTLLVQHAGWPWASPSRL